jgi:hypothetical protein
MFENIDTIKYNITTIKPENVQHNGQQIVQQSIHMSIVH